MGGSIVASRTGGRAGGGRGGFIASPSPHDSRDETRSVGVRGVGVRGAVPVGGGWPLGWRWTVSELDSPPAAPRYLQPFFRILLLGHRAIPMRFPRRFWVGSAMASPRGRTGRSGVPWWWWCLTCP